MQAVYVARRHYRVAHGVDFYPDDMFLKKDRNARILKMRRERQERYRDRLKKSGTARQLPRGGDRTNSSNEVASKFDTALRQALKVDDIFDDPDMESRRMRKWMREMMLKEIKPGDDVFTALKKVTELLKGGYRASCDTENDLYEGLDDEVDEEGNQMWLSQRD